MKRAAYSIAALSLLCIQGVLADVTVKYKITTQEGNAKQVIYFTDKQHIRQETYDGEKLLSSILKLGDKVYVINDGQAINISSGLGAMGASLSNMFGRKKESAPAKFEATGRYERIAGIKGEVYRVTQNGETHQVVLGRNQDLFKVTQASMDLAKSMIGKSAADQMFKQVKQAPSLKGMAMLRFDHVMELTSLKSAPIPKSKFELPAGAKSNSALPTDKESPSGQSDMGNLLKGIFGR